MAIAVMFACCWRGLRNVPPIDGKFTGGMAIAGDAMACCLTDVLIAYSRNRPFGRHVTSSLLCVPRA